MARQGANPANQRWWVKGDTAGVGGKRSSLWGKGICVSWARPDFGQMLREFFIEKQGVVVKKRGHIEKKKQANEGTWFYTNEEGGGVFARPTGEKKKRKKKFRKKKGKELGRDQKGAQADVFRIGQHRADDGTQTKNHSF